MRYRFLLCDNDDTLMDFQCAERVSVSGALGAFGLIADDATCDAYHHINLRLWQAHERGEITQDALRVERFAQLLTHLGREDVSATALAAEFHARLRERADLMEGAMAFLTAVHGQMKIALVSNGVGETQRSRLARCPFTPMLDAIIISGEVGVSKPDARIVTMALEALGCDNKAEAVLLGDSATADIAAANNAGIDSIHMTQKDFSAQATYTARTLDEALRILQNA